MKMLSSRTRLMVAALSLATAHCGHAQLAHLGPSGMVRLSEATPTYDVSSVKVNNSGDGSFGLSISDTNGTLTATNVPIEMMIEYAYDVKPDHIFGLAGPIKNVQFDVQAKVLAKPEGQQKLKDHQLQAMMIPLLADRFHLKAHIEQRTLPVYELVVNRGGPKLKLSNEPASNSSTNMSANNTDRVLTSKAASMPDLAQALSDLVHRQVIDKTGLEGRADITVQWTADEAADQGVPVLSIFTALEEQLGLKLVSSKGPVEVLVIDHIEMPTEN